MSSHRSVHALLIAVAVAACDDPITSPSPIPGPHPEPAQFVIADGAHGGVKSFYFLPPMVPVPQYSGTFDATKSPNVRVCQLSGGACGIIIASFGATQIKVDVTTESYSVVWKTKDAGLDASKVYRVEVLVGPQVMGFADVAVLSNGKQVKVLGANQTAAVVDGGALPIRFRLESGAATPPPPPGSWASNVYVTYTQAAWGDPQSTGGTLLVARYDAIYSAPSALLTVGSPFPTGNALVFTSAKAVLDFLPQSGPSTSTLGRLIDPLTSPAGLIGGEAVALSLNLQFSSARQTPAPNGVPFGDLVLCKFEPGSAWNGVSVGDFLLTVSTILMNGWAPSLYITLGEVEQMAAQLNASFANGIPSQFAQEHLVAGTCPGAWKFGDVISYTDYTWKNPVAADVLTTRFSLLYPYSAMEVGISGLAGYSIIFTEASKILAYLPGGGFPGSLTTDHLNPSSTESGIFGGATLALQLDVEFSDAGYLSGTPGVRFGDLSICGLADRRAAVQGETVRMLLARATQMLGGAIPFYGGPYEGAELFELLEDVARGFESGAPSYFARAHLVNGTCP